MLASRGVVETIETTAQAELSQVSASVVAEVRSWYSQYLQGFNELARLVATEGFASPDHLQQHLVLSKRMLPDLVSLAAVSADKATVLASTSTTENFAYPVNQPYIQTSQTTLQPILSDPFRTNENLLPRVVLNLPIVQGPELLGFVTGEIALERIETLLKNYTSAMSQLNFRVVTFGKTDYVLISEITDPNF